MLMPLAQNELELMRCLRNQNRFSFLTSNIITEEMQQLWYQKYLQRSEDYMFSVLVRKAHTWIGTVALYDIDREKQQAEFGRLMIDRKAAGRGGMGYEATMCACEIGFQQLGLQRIYLDVFADNLPAVKTYEKAGFHIYGKKEASGRELLYMEKERMQNYGNSSIKTEVSC